MYGTQDLMLRRILKSFWFSGELNKALLEFQFSPLKEIVALNLTHMSAIVRLDNLTWPTEDTPP